jgi:DNA-binding MarR family transcriptional regulator
MGQEVGTSLAFDPIAEARRQWEAHDWPDEADAMAAVISIMRAAQILLSRVDRALKPFGLTFARFEALTLLSFSYEGSLPLGKMGERLQVHPTSVTNAIDRLETQGLVRRLPHPTDRRTVLAEITPRGRELAAGAAATLNSEVFASMGLEPAELENLFRLLHKLRAASGDFGG